MKKNDRISQVVAATNEQAEVTSRTEDTAASKYSVTELPDGFRIEADDRNTVIVRCTGTGFVLAYRDERQTEVRLPFGLYKYRDMSAAIGKVLMMNWRPRKGFPGARSWAAGKAAGAVGKRVHNQWQRLLDRVDPRVAAVQKAVFSATLQAPDVLNTLELYEDDHLFADICRYPAAAAAVGYFDALQDTHRDVTGRARMWSLDLALLRNWQNLYSATGERYRSLSRTLMNLPGGLGKSVQYLPLIRLQRPFYSRVELGTLLMFAQATSESRLHAAQERFHDVFMFATGEQIGNAFELFKEETQAVSSTRRVDDLNRFVRYLCDFPGDHRGAITGLARKSIAWHRDNPQDQVPEFAWPTGGAADVDMAGAEVPRPELPIPNEPGVTLLDSVEAIAEEGKRMRHCVGTYARGAVNGDYHLFHVEREGHHATIQVSKTGELIQAYGPRNSINDATRWGSRVLGRWGRELAKARRKTPNM